MGGGGLNNAIEGGGAWADFLERCAERKIAIHGCEVEREPFPLPTGSVDAVLFCELFEHLHLNPFHTLKEIFRILRPGGLLLLTTPNLRRVETLSRLWHGWGSQPPVGRPFHELFPSLLYHRHNREYTAAELTYYLALQGRISMTSVSTACTTPTRSTPRTRSRASRPAGRLLGAAVRGPAAPLPPGFAASSSPGPGGPDATLVAWDALDAVEGFGPVEEDDRPVQGFTRRLTFPVPSDRARAGFASDAARGRPRAHLPGGRQPRWRRRRPSAPSGRLAARRR